jgi:DNA-binding GntR family transcriptional regulator
LQIADSQGRSAVSRTPSAVRNLTERSGMARRKFTRRSWSREEDELIDGHVRALADGRYPDRTAAARACARDIERLYASLRARDPNHHLATRERPLASLVQRLVVRSKALGLK